MFRNVMRVLATAVVTAVATTAVPVAAATPSKAGTNDSFYTYEGSDPLSSYAPGTVLKKRTLQYHIESLPTPVKAVQLLYRTNDAQGRPAANVTTVVRSLTGDS
ncbi:MAG TPA: triacylglycerol lipase, partial [Streptomyces sp.]|nr:triacylglycerol lipase [Streptomyces sp.]